MQVFNGRATVKQLVQNWSISYVGNMIGASIIIALMCGGAVFPYQPAGLLKMAMPKVSLTFKQVSVASIVYQHHYTQAPSRKDGHIHLLLMYTLPLPLPLPVPPLNLMCSKDGPII